MMEFIRERANSPVVKFLFLGILISFLGFGSVSIFSGGANKVATVNGETIPVEMLQREYEDLLRQQENVDKFTEQDHQQLKQMAMQNIFERTVLDQALRNWGITASNSDVAKAIMGNPSFQEEGEFSTNLYQDILKQSRIKQEAYEANVRQNLAIQKMLQNITDTAFVAPKSIENIAKISNEKRDIKLASLYYDQLDQLIEIDDAEIETEYNVNLSKYVTDERYKISYIELENNTEFSGVEISDAELKVALEQKEQESARTADQIIIEPNNEEERLAALDKLKTLYAEIERGDITFDDVVKTMESDKNTFYLESNRYTRNIIESEVIKDKLFSMTMENPILEPFESETAIHLIRLKEIDKAYPSVDAVREEIQKEKVKADYFAKVSRLQELSELYTDGLNEIASDLGVVVKTTDWILLNDTNSILGTAAVREAFMTADVIEYHKNSLPFSLDDEHAMILRVSEYEPSRSKTLEEAQAQIKEVLETEKLEAVGLDKIGKIEKKLSESKADFETIVREEGFEFAEYNGLKIADMQRLGLKPVEMMAIFAAFQTEGNIPQGEFVLHTDKQPIGISLTQISNVVSGKLEEFSEDQREQTINNMKIEQMSAEYRALIDGLIEESDIKIYQNDFLK